MTGLQAGRPLCKEIESKNNALSTKSGGLLYFYTLKLWIEQVILAIRLIFIDLFFYPHLNEKFYVGFVHFFSCNY